MKKHLPAVLLLAAVIIFTACVITVDVQAVGPESSEIGFATINTAFHRLTGFNNFFYMVSKVLGVIPFAFAGPFALLGFTQLCSRKSLLKVDTEILLLGVIYILTIVIYMAFEKFPVNYRPILMENQLEASYPSSHTLLALVISVTAIPLFRKYIKNNVICRFFQILAAVLAVLIPLTRLLSGVHWLTDIIGGILFSLLLIEVFREHLSRIRNQ